MVCLFILVVVSPSKMFGEGLPRGPVDKNPLPMQGTPVQSQIRRISHAMEHLSPCTNYWSSCTQSLSSATGEATATRSQCARTSRPFLQLESQLPKTKTQVAAKGKNWRRLPLTMNFGSSDPSQIRRFLVINYITHSSCTSKGIYQKMLSGSQN